MTSLGVYYAPYQDRTKHTAHVRFDDQSLEAGQPLLQEAHVTQHGALRQVRARNAQAHVPPQVAGLRPQLPPPPADGRHRAEPADRQGVRQRSGAQGSACTGHLQPVTVHSSRPG